MTPFREFAANIAAMSIFALVGAMCMDHLALGPWTRGIVGFLVWSMLPAGIMAFLRLLARLDVYD